MRDAQQRCRCDLADGHHQSVGELPIRANRRRRSMDIRRPGRTRPLLGCGRGGNPAIGGRGTKLPASLRRVSGMAVRRAVFRRNGHHVRPGKLRRAGGHPAHHRWRPNMGASYHIEPRLPARRRLPDATARLRCRAGSSDNQLAKPGRADLPSAAVSLEAGPQVRAVLRPASMLGRGR